MPFRPLKHFAFITTCMHRLNQAQQSSKRLMQDARIDGQRHHYIFVDFACPEHSGDWIEQTYGKRTNVVHVQGPHSKDFEVLFHKTKALNLGAQRAAVLGANYLVFIDADFLTCEKLQDYIFQYAHPDQFMVFLPKKEQRDLCGFLGVPLVAFQQVNGFDERMIGWGSEDLDMRLKLFLQEKLTCHVAPIDLAETIPHDDHLRLRHAPYPKQVSNRKNMRLLNENMLRITGKSLRELLRDTHHIELLIRATPENEIEEGPDSHDNCDSDQ